MTVLQTRQAQALFEDLDSIEKRVKAAGQIALFLDFDGTISKIVPVPADAVIDPEIRPVLEKLAARPDFSLGIVSGRTLEDVRRRAGLRNVMYVGNHGLEIEAGETRFREPEAEALRRELKCVFLQLKLALADIEGVEVEDKALTLSVHFRRVAEDLHGWIRRVSLEAVNRSRSFLAMEGNRTIEVRPQLAWNKGHAVKWLLREVLPASALPIYIGDDVSDEDAFSAMQRGITIRVGGLPASQTDAQYYVRDVSAVGQFLNWLDHAKSNASLANSQRAGK